MVNTKLERHFTGPHTLLNEVSAFLYIYIDFYTRLLRIYVHVCVYVCEFCFFFVAEEGQVELQEAVKLWSKRDRESLMNNQSERKRTSSKREEGEESTEESVVDKEYFTVVVDNNNHRRPTRSLRHWKVADGMIGISVQRKACSYKNLNLPNTSSFCDCRYKEEENGGWEKFRYGWEQWNLIGHKLNNPLW